MISVIVAVGSAPWEAKLVSTLSHPMSEFRIVRRCVDGVDVRAVAAVHVVDAVLISDDTLRVDVNLIAELRVSGVRVVALSSDTTFWNNLGVAGCLVVDPSNISQSIAELADLLTDAPVRVTAECESSPLVACASFGGGVGRSLISRELSYFLASNGRTTVCVEADTFGPTLSQDLNLATGTFNLLDAYRLMNAQDSDDERDAFVEHLSVVRENLAVLPGPARASQWIEFRPDLMTGAYRRLQHCFDFTVVDVGPMLESDFNLSSDSNYPSRLATSLTAIAQASDVILCARAETASVTRLIKHFLELADLFSQVDVHVVLNQVRDPKLAIELEKSVLRYTGISSVVTIADCHQYVAKATSKVHFVSELAKQSPLALGIERLGNNLLSRRTTSATTEKMRQILQAQNVA